MTDTTFFLNRLSSEPHALAFGGQSTLGRRRSPTRATTPPLPPRSTRTPMRPTGCW